MDLINQANNAQLTFTEGSEEASEFTAIFRILNPGTALKNTANFTADVINQTALPGISPLNGAFSGSFTLTGASSALNRKVTFQGQIVRHADDICGYGFFLLPDLPKGPNQTLKQMPQRSGKVLLKAAP